MDGVVETCAWYITLSGGNPMTGKEMKDEKACAIAWQPILMIEAARETKGVAASVQSLRNETTKRMDAQLALELVDNEKYIEHS